MKAFRAMCLVMLVVALLSHFSLPVTAQAPAALDDPAELEAFLDGQMEAYMRTDHVAGAVITVVKDGEVFFSKGYGLADVEQALPVSPDTTLFRPGSVSKLFTWTAVMQLVEQGRLDLDADVNTYLSAFQIPRLPRAHSTAAPSPTPPV